jgi:hypothetical protein
MEGLLSVAEFQIHDKLTNLKQLRTLLVEELIISDIYCLVKRV